MSVVTADRNQTSTLPLVVLTAFLIGANFTSLKFALDHTTPLVLTAMRTIVGGVALLGFALARGERLPRRADELLSIFVVSLAITSLSSMALVAGVNRVSSGVGALMSSTMPLFMAVLAALLLNERPGVLGSAGVAFGFVGAAVLASPALEGDTQTVGIILLLVATFSWAIGSVLMKLLKPLASVSPLMIVAVQLPMSAVIVSIVALTSEGLDGTTWTPKLILPLLYSSIPAMAVSFSLMATVIRRAPAIQAASVAYLSPLFGVLIAWIVRGDGLSWVEAIGGCLVVLGVGLVSMATARRAQAAQAA